MNPEIDEKPGPTPLIFYGLQWWAVMMPSVIILGLVAAKLQHPANPAAQIAVLQKLFCITGITSAAQILFGHRLPIVTGPASVVLIGMIACRGASNAAMYTGIFAGGLFIAVLTVTGLLGRMQKAFTFRVLVVIMLLIPFTLTPSILGLVFQNPGHHLFNMLFAVCFLAALLVAGKILKGVWKATTILWVMIAGSLVCFAVHGFPGIVDAAGEKTPFFAGLEFDAGVILAFVFCAMAMTLNEISSIQAIAMGLKADAVEARTRRGVIVNSAANMASGLVGVIGPVDYMTSVGIIESTKYASRFPFLPAAALLVVGGFWPDFLGLLLTIPGPVLGMVLFYVMASQMASGLQMIGRERAVMTFADGLTLAIPLMASVMASYLSPDISAVLPAVVRPIFANAFVVGVITVMILEHAYNREEQ